jgi:hypothetical protein
MADLMQVARVAVKLESALQTMKRLHGDKWEERAAPYRAVLNDVIGVEGCSVLEAALLIAKAMSDAGEMPVMLLAVAAEMCNANIGICANPPAEPGAGDGGGRLERRT